MRGEGSGVRSNQRLRHVRPVAVVYGDDAQLPFRAEKRACSLHVHFTSPFSESHYERAVDARTSDAEAASFLQKRYTSYVAYSIGSKNGSERSHSYNPALHGSLTNPVFIGKACKPPLPTDGKVVRSRLFTCWRKCAQCSATKPGQQRTVSTSSTRITNPLCVDGGVNSLLLLGSSRLLRDRRASRNSGDHGNSNQRWHGYFHV